MNSRMNRNLIPHPIQQMKTLKFLFSFIVLLTIFSACTLNAEQEASLAESTTHYLEARRNGALLAYVSMQHPAVVKHYKMKSDSLFLAKYELKSQGYFIDDPVIKDIVRRGDKIHVKYEAKAVLTEMDEGENKSFSFVAISEDAGRTWFYMDYHDYVDKTVAIDFERLLTE